MAEYRKLLAAALILLSTVLPFMACSSLAVPPSAAPVPATAAPVLAVKPDNLTFIIGSGQPAAQDQVIAITNQGGGLLNLSGSDNSPWLTLQKGPGQAGSSVVAARVLVDSYGMLPGSYTGVISIAADGALNSPVHIPVYLTVQQGAGGVPAPAPVVTGTSVQPGPADVAWVNQSDFYQYASSNAIIVNGQITNNNRSWYMRNVKIIAADSGAGVTVADQIPPGETVMYNRYIPSFQRQQVSLDYTWFKP